MEHPEKSSHRATENLCSTHGAKMSFLSINQPIKKIQLGNALNFYQEYRNEPVPPDPLITSAVKLVPSRLTRPNADAKGLDLGKPIKTRKQPLQPGWLEKRNEKTEASIPFYSGFAHIVPVEFEKNSKCNHVNHSIAKGPISSLQSGCKDSPEGSINTSKLVDSDLKRKVPEIEDVEMKLNLRLKEKEAWSLEKSSMISNQVFFIQKLKIEMQKERQKFAAHKVAFEKEKAAYLTELQKMIKEWQTLNAKAQSVQKDLLRMDLKEGQNIAAAVKLCEAQKEQEITENLAELFKVAIAEKQDKASMNFHTAEEYTVGEEQDIILNLSCIITSCLKHSKKCEKKYKTMIAERDEEIVRLLALIPSPKDKD